MSPDGAPKIAPRTVVITGVSSGIGKSLALTFARAGYSVAGCARSHAALQELQLELTRWSPHSRTYTCDVTQRADVEAMLEDVLSRSGSIDVLINNAGTYGPIGEFQDCDALEWWRAVETNLLSVFLVSQLVVPVMRAAGRGKIINVSGGGATAPMPRYSAYAASKAAVVRFTESTAGELASANIQVNAIAPGFLATRIHEATLAAGEAKAGAFYHETRALMEKGQKGGDAETLQRVGELALFLASAQSGSLTGRLISAKWDDWEKMAQALEAQPVSSLATLRRIDNVKYFERN